MTQKQANEATEGDLWDLDSDDSESSSPAATPSAQSGLPSRRTAGESSIQSKKPTERQTELPLSKADEPTPAKEKPAREAKVTKPSEAEAAAEILPEKPEADDLVADETEDTAVDSNPISPVAVIASFSKIEKIAISSLVAVLALGATLAFIHFSNRVPTRPLVSEEIDFPVSGKIVEITAAKTYWREPVTTGENPDVVRRGTKLIPVVKLNLKSKSGAIRVFFRNDEGLVIGDGITHSVKGENEITIAATAGFEDVGMHTAYRTGDSPPWVVQIFEAPDSKAPREKFRQVLEMEISTIVR